MWWMFTIWDNIYQRKVISAWNWMDREILARSVCHIRRKERDRRKRNDAK